MADSSLSMRDFPSGTDTPTGTIVRHIRSEQKNPVMKQIQWLMPACATVLLCACSTLPHFNAAATREGVRPRVSDMVDEIQCEILSALARSSEKNSPLAGLQDGQYVVNVNLTLDVTNNQSVNPTLSYIDPFQTAGTNFTAGLSGELSGQQHRNFNVTFTLLFDRSTPTDPTCSGAHRGSGLKGDLGIEEIIATGLRYETGFLDQNGYPYKIPVIGVGTLLGPSDPLTNGPALPPCFGSTIDFTLIYGGGVGPSWTLTHFTGVSPSSGGLLSFMRTNKDTLVLSFARIGLTAPTPPPAAATDVETRAYAAAVQDYKRSYPLYFQAAVKASQDNVTRMILQRLLFP